MTEPDLYPSPLIGYKALLVKGIPWIRTRVVVSPFASKTIWWREEGAVPKEQKAVCGNDFRPYKGHPAPHPDCACGLFSYNSLEAALESSDGGYGTSSAIRTASMGIKSRRLSDWLVVMTSSYGDWYVNEVTHRAEKQRISAICLSSSVDREVLLQIAKDLDVPLMSWHDMVDFAKESGLSA